MKATVTFSSKCLNSLLTPYEDQSIIRAVVNCFLMACLQYVHRPHCGDWHSFYELFVSESFATATVQSRVDSYIDHQSGKIHYNGLHYVYNNNTDTGFDNWYSRYQELMTSIDYYYRETVISTIQYIEQQAYIHHLGYIKHDDRVILADMDYRLLLTQD